jgi:hypothetical protein
VLLFFTSKQRLFLMLDYNIISQSVSYLQLLYYVE